MSAATPISIQALRCPVCGAPLSERSSRCDYCGSVLVLMTNHLRIDPDSINRAVVDAKIAEFRSRLKDDPSDVMAHYGLGMAYFNLKLTEDAIRELETAAQLTPENAFIQAQLAVVLREAQKDGIAGSGNRMQRRMANALRLDPDNVDALLLKSEGERARNGLRAGIPTLQRAYEANPVRVRPVLGDVLERLIADASTRLSDRNLASSERRRLEASLASDRTLLAQVDPARSQGTTTKETPLNSRGFAKARASAGPAPTGRRGLVPALLIAFGQWLGLVLIVVVACMILYASTDSEVFSTIAAWVILASPLVLIGWSVRAVIRR